MFHFLDGQEDLGHSPLLAFLSESNNYITVYITAAWLTRFCLSYGFSIAGIILKILYWEPDVKHKRLKIVSYEGVLPSLRARTS